MRRHIVIGQVEATLVIPDDESEGTELSRSGALRPIRGRLRPSLPLGHFQNEAAIGVSQSLSSEGPWT